MARGKGKTRTAKRKITRSFKRKSPARKAVKRALRDNRVTKKEIRTIIRKGGTKKQVQSIRKAAKKTKGLKIGKGVDNKKEIKKIFKRNKGKGKAENLRSDQLTIKGGGGGGSGGGSGGGGGGGGGRGGSGGGGGGKKTKVKADALEGDYGQKDFSRREKKLKKRAKQYQSIYGGKTAQSRKFLKALADQATTRMKIDPKEYGRKGKKAKYKNLSIAEQYDRNPAKLEEKLSNPMNEFMKRQAKKADGDGPLAYLSNFRNKANPEFAEFNASRMQKFAQSGLTGKGKGNRKMKRLAKSLGIGNKRFEMRRNPGRVFGRARNRLQGQVRKNKNFTLGRAMNRLNKEMNRKEETGSSPTGSFDNYLTKQPGVYANKKEGRKAARRESLFAIGDRRQSIVPFKNKREKRKAAKRGTKFGSIMSQAYDSV